MQYILTEEEYRNLAPVSKVKKLEEQIDRLNAKVLELRHHGICMRDKGGYCDFCALSGLGTCKKSKNYSK